MVVLRLIVTAARHTVSKTRDLQGTSGVLN